MNNQMQSHLFWGINSPLSALTGAALLVIASGRVASAFVCVLALIWVNVLTMLAASAGRKALPETGTIPVLVFVASFALLLFFFILYLINPFMAMESFFFLALCPAFLFNSFLPSKHNDYIKDYDIPELLFHAASEAFVLGALVFAVALIREPLGSGSLSLSGMTSGRFMEKAPLAFFQASSGALIILGYGIALYRRFRDRHEEEED